MYAADLIDWDSPVSDDPLNRSLLGWWLAGSENPFWGTLTFRDLVPRGAGAGGNHGTLTGGPTWVSGAGRPGGRGALSFDGTDDYTDASDAGFPAGAAQRTLSCWFYLPAAPASSFNAFASYGRPGNATGGSTYEMFIPGVTSTPAIFLSSYGAGTLVGATTFTTGRWYHYAAVVNSGTSVALYLDGKQDAAGDTTGGMGMNTVLNGHLVLGCRWDGDSSRTEFLAIRLDDVRVHSRALSAAEVFGLYDDSRRGYPRTLRRLVRRTYYVPQVAPPAGDAVPVCWAQYRRRAG